MFCVVYVWRITQILETDEFDTTVTGPWIGRWPITHHNRHTELFQQHAKQ